LKRRNVVPVGIAFVLMGWLLQQAADFALDLIDIGPVPIASQESSFPVCCKDTVGGGRRWRASTVVRANLTEGYRI
jgi:hypothetical protein